MSDIRDQLASAEMAGESNDILQESFQDVMDKATAVLKTLPERARRVASDIDPVASEMILAGTTPELRDAFRSYNLVYDSLRDYKKHRHRHRDSGEKKKRSEKEEKKTSQRRRSRGEDEKSEDSGEMEGSRTHKRRRGPI